MVLILSEYSNTSIYLLKVIKMVLIHDIVEIDAGDKLVYSRNKSKTQNDEILATERIFGMLPETQKNKLIK